MEKVCVFCGMQPNDKNKEHIIPKWLMKLTGTENKKMSVGTNWKLQKEIIFNFSSFTFPACKKCNDKFARVESLVKPVVEKILNDDFVNDSELILLLDWLDKIRVSLWLGVQYHNRGTFDLPPKYFVNTRLGLKDRLVAITNCYDSYRGFRWTGVNTLCFMISPVCVTLKINELLVTNCSMDFVVSEQLGFPYPIFERPNPNSHLTDFKITTGKYRTDARLFKSDLYAPTTIVSQPIYKVSKELMPEYYENEYVKMNSIDFNSGIGQLFITQNGQTKRINSGGISFGDVSRTRKSFKYNRPTLEFQMELLQRRRQNFELLSEEEIFLERSGLDFILAYTQEQINQYDY